MASGLSFKVLLQLQDKAFKNGVNSAKRQLMNLKRTFLSVASALGAGLGLTQIISEIKETSVKLSVATATLKNVSRDAQEFANNQEYLQKLAKDYKQDIIGLTNNFAQFKASADFCNVSLENQQKIYTSLAKASAYYHMSADRTKDMLIAITQMMSKGKVTAEELRRQLGNALPAAFGIMSKAVGVSQAELEHMMKTGQLVSGEVLPKFADELDKITKDIDLNSLQLAMNDLHNAWTNLVNEGGFEQKLTNLVNTAKDVLNWLTGNLGMVKNALLSIAVAVIIPKVIPAIKAIGKAFTAISKGSWIGIIAGALVMFIGYINEMNKKLNKSALALKKMQNISEMTDKYEQYYEAKKQKAEAEAYLNNADMAAYNRAKQHQKQIENEGTTPLTDKMAAANPILAGFDEFQMARTGEAMMTQLSSKEKTLIRDVENWNAVLEQSNTIINNLQSDIDKLEQESNSPIITDEPTQLPATSQPKTPSELLQEELEKYQEKKSKLDNQKEAGSITSEEYNEELKRLEDTTWKNITAFNDFRTILSNLPQNIQDVASGLENAFGSNRAKEATDKEAERQKLIANAPILKSPSTDTFFNYKKDESEIGNEAADALKDYSAEIQEAIDYWKENFEEGDATATSKLTELQKLLDDTQQQATTMYDKARLAEWKKDVKDLQKEYNEGLYKSTTNLIGNLKQCVNGFKALKNTLEDEDASEFEKIVAVIEQIVEAIDMVKTAYEGMKAVQETYALLTKAQNAEEANQLMQQIALEQMKGSVAAKTGAEIVATNMAEATSSNISASANAAEAVAGATASGAKLAFPYNLLAIAAGIAAVVAGLAMMSKFADGGIVGGHSKTGDKLFARVNSGEMILNDKQQNTLWSMLNNKSSNYANVNFKIRGSDLVGTINNYNSQRKG